MDTELVNSENAHEQLPQEIAVPDAFLLNTKIFEIMVGEASKIINNYVEGEKEIAKTKAETSKYEVDKYYAYREKDLQTQTTLAKWQMSIHVVTLFAAISAMIILAATGHLTESFIAIIAVIIGSVLKYNLTDFIKPAKPKEEQ